jgi:DMSO/TMAO reductase YedYZ molybdopterin-dependent catalytic subunit
VFPNKIMTRRRFLLVVSATATGLLAGCRPGDDPPAPTLYKSGQALPTGEVVAGEFSLPDPRYGTITYHEIMTVDNQQFYVQTYPNADVPTYEDVNAEWSLTIDGLVDNPRVYTYEALRMMPEYTEMRTLQCIGNPVGGRLVGNAVWSGVLLKDILTEVGVKPSATRARFYAADGYHTAVDVEWIVQDKTFLAYKMNGQLLPRSHGYPMRIFMPGLYGQKQPKWIERIEFIDYDYQGYWEKLGWSDVADIQTNSIIRTPPTQSNIGGTVAIQGIANAGNRRITQVEVKVEDGDWMPATLTQTDSSLVWTQWYILWTPPSPGTFAIQVRATDETGFVQTHPATGQFGRAKPDGTDAIHAIVVEVI